MLCILYAHIYIYILYIVYDIYIYRRACIHIYAYHIYI